VITLHRRGVLPDLTLSGGVRVWNNSGADTRGGFARVRVGVTLFAEPTFAIAGIAAQWSALNASQLGLQGEVANSESGLWGAVGVWGFDRFGGLAFDGELGWSVFGVEYDRRVSGTRSGDSTLCLMMRVPLGVIWALVRLPSGVVRGSS
jgi:hypothetical protein